MYLEIEKHGQCVYPRKPIYNFITFLQADLHTMRNQTLASQGYQRHPA